VKHIFFSDSRSCREVEADIFGAYLSFGVLIISPKFRLKTPSGLRDSSIESLGLFHGLFSGLSRMIQR
jgi:hypothetical protein